MAVSVRSFLLGGFSLSKHITSDGMTDEEAPMLRQQFVARKSCGDFREP
jgi:hypothetical protein